MSAWMLYAAHFDAMADYAARRNTNPGPFLRSPEMEGAHREFMRWTGGIMPYGLGAYRAAIGTVLHAQNRRSVLARYPNAGDDYFPAYHPQRVTAPLTPQRALAAVACYEYQACETSDFETTLAYAFCRMIETAAIAELRDGEPWGLTEDHVRPAVSTFPKEA